MKAEGGSQSVSSRSNAPVACSFGSAPFGTPSKTLQVGGFGVLLNTLKSKEPQVNLLRPSRPTQGGLFGSPFFI